jgi:diketogulonate reductase-like aldo/keto reductase
MRARRGNLSLASTVALHSGGGRMPLLGLGTFQMQHDGEARARLHCRFTLLIHFIPDSLTYSVPLFLKRQRDRTPGEAKRAVLAALRAGYRMVDTARNYENEAEVGRGAQAKYFFVWRTEKP